MEPSGEIFAAAMCGPHIVSVHSSWDSILDTVSEESVDDNTYVSH